MSQSPLALTRYQVFRGGPLGARYPVLYAHSSSTPNGAIPFVCRLPLSTATESGQTLTFRRVVALLPQRLSLTFKHAQVDGILTPSEMSCLSAGCRCKDLAGFLPRPRSILSFPGFQLPLPLTHQFLSQGRSYTQRTFSRKRMDPLLHIAMVVYPEHPDRKSVV